MAKTYTDLGNTDIKRMKSNAVTAKKVATQNYTAGKQAVDAAANNAAKDTAQMYRASRNRLGNMSGTAKNRLEVSAGNSVSGLNTAKAMAASSMRANTKQIKSAVSQNYQTNKSKTRQTYGLKAQAEKVERHTKRMNIYKDTASRFDTTKKCDAAIKKLKASNDPDKAEKIAYIRAQRAALLQAEREKKSGWHSWGGRGWHRWGGGWRNYGGGNGDDTNVTINDGTTELSKQDMTRISEHAQKNASGYPTAEAIERAKKNQAKRKASEEKKAKAEKKQAYLERAYNNRNRSKRRSERQ